MSSLQLFIRAVLVQLSGTMRLQRTMAADFHLLASFTNVPAMITCASARDDSQIGQWLVKNGTPSFGNSEVAALDDYCSRFFSVRTAAVAPQFWRSQDMTNC